MAERAAAETIRSVSGIVASVCTTGAITPQFAMHLSHLRSHNDRNGIHNVEYKVFDAKLVEIGRDAVCDHALSAGYEWLLMIDADAAPFPPETLEKFLRLAFVDHPEIDVLGAYCQLKQPPYPPTIDTGTGKWELSPPQRGLIKVIRTGGHFVLVKTRILPKIGPPWFRTRRTIKPIAALKEIDTFARTVLDGKNPLAAAEAWRTLLDVASREAHHQKENAVGEDSGFCDRVTSGGGIICIDTDTVVGHVATKIIMPEDLKGEVIDTIERRFAHVGVRGYR